MNVVIRSHGMKAGLPVYLWSKYKCFLMHGCQDMNFWKTWTLNFNTDKYDQGDDNSSPCTSYRRAKNVYRQFDQKNQAFYQYKSFPLYGVIRATSMSGASNLALCNSLLYSMLTLPFLITEDSQRCWDILLSYNHSHLHVPWKYINIFMVAFWSCHSYTPWYSEFIIFSSILYSCQYI